MRRRFLREGFEDVKKFIVRIRVNLTGRIYLADILTSIRALEGAITVSQREPLEPAPGGKNMLNVNLKFEELPGRGIEQFVENVKKIEGVDMARIFTDEEFKASEEKRQKDKDAAKAAETTPEKVAPPPPAASIKKAEQAPKVKKPAKPPAPKVPMGTKLLKDLVSEILRAQR